MREIGDRDSHQKNASKRPKPCSPQNHSAILVKRLNLDQLQRGPGLSTWEIREFGDRASHREISKEARALQPGKLPFG